MYAAWFDGYSSAGLCTRDSAAVDASGSPSAQICFQAWQQPNALWLMLSAHVTLRVNVVGGLALLPTGLN